MVGGRPIDANAFRLALRSSDTSSTADLPSNDLHVFFFTQFLAAERKIMDATTKSTQTHDTALLPTSNPNPRTAKTATAAAATATSQHPVTPGAPLRGAIDGAAIRRGRWRRVVPNYGVSCRPESLLPFRPLTRGGGQCSSNKPVSARRASRRSQASPPPRAAARSACSTDSPTVTNPHATVGGPRARAAAAQPVRDAAPAVLQRAW
jgi:hypothetical protein